ncbi:LysR family transcriptional regulator substrate-binding protein [Streptomyces sp. YGL11-2]|uniref:LysR family transcriptional regulator substrate-binding protein n=1 Tax=Streptomyces sp. YGL11-2 TaxID=3414028 RepID=UPI003CE75658
MARHELSLLAGLSGGRLRVGTFMTAGTRLLPPALSAFRRAHPDVELSVTEYVPPEGTEALAVGEVDLALTHEYVPGEALPTPDGVRLEALLSEELVLVTAPGHALSAGSGRLPLTELAGQPLVSMAPADPNRRAGEAALAAAGASVAVRCESPGYAVVCALVSAGLGVAVVPEMMATGSVTPLGIRHLEPPELRRRISVAYRPGRGHPARAAARRLRPPPGPQRPETLTTAAGRGGLRAPAPATASRSRRSCRRWRSAPRRAGRRVPRPGSG